MLPLATPAPGEHADPAAEHCPGLHGVHAEANPWHPEHQVLGDGPDPLLYWQCQDELVLPDQGQGARCGHVQLQLPSSRPDQNLQRLLVPGSCRQLWP